jgi:hypothetical protein
MLESDADRLESIKALGGLLVTCPRCNFWAIFDADYVNADGVDESGPALTCRMIDVSLLRKGDSVTVGVDAFRVRGFQPDGTGMTTVRLGA